MNRKHLTLAPHWWDLIPVRPASSLRFELLYGISGVGTQQISAIAEAVAEALGGKERSWTRSSGR